MKKRLLCLSSALIMTVSTVTAFADEVKMTVDEDQKSGIVQPRQNYAKVTGNGVRMRKSPGTSSAVVRTLNKGNVVSLYSVSSVWKDNQYWSKCSYGGSVGWVSEKYLAFE